MDRLVIRDGHRPAAHRLRGDRLRPVRRHCASSIWCGRIRIWSFPRTMPARTAASPLRSWPPGCFSFNNPYGACPTCTGLGFQLKVDPELIIPDRELSILEGAITASGWNSIRSDGISRMYFDALAKKYKFKLNDPIKNLSDAAVEAILYGTKGEKLTMTYENARGKGSLSSSPLKVLSTIWSAVIRRPSPTACSRELEDCMSNRPCPACGGKRLRPEVPGRHGGRPVHPRLLPAAYHSGAGVHAEPDPHRAAAAALPIRSSRRFVPGWAF